MSTNPPNPHMICPHCKTKGVVSTKAAPMKVETLLERVEARCTKCGAVWYFEGTVETPPPPKSNWNQQYEEAKAKIEEEARKPIECPVCGIEYARPEKVCPDCGARNPTRPSTLKLVFYWALAILVVGVCIQQCAESMRDSRAAENASQEQKAQEVAQEALEPQTAYLPNVVPSGVYLTLEENGFQTEKNLDPVNGCLWTSKKEMAGIEYTVEQFSPDSPSKTQSIRATAQLLGGEKQIQASLWLFKAIATTPFPGEKAKQAMEWVEGNFDNDKVSTSIGGVKLEMYAPTQFVRMLRVSAP